MLKTRVISAIVGLILIIGTIVISKETFSIAVFLLALVGIHEYYSSMNNIGLKPIKPVGYFASLVILLAGNGDWLLAKISKPELFINSHSYDAGSISKEGAAILFVIFIFTFFLFAISVFKFGKYNVTDISITLYGIFYVIFLFLFAVLTRNLEHGLFYIWFVLIGAWSTDTSAYFIGRKFGKKKLAPLLSPNKTIEGSIAGVIGSIAGVAIYGIYLQKYLSHVPFYHYIIIGLLCGIISQVGDLVASSIKRYTKVKDFGKIIPGHGGVLDRFDSVLLTTPVIYFYIITFML
ncbi:MAG TPA: phosphatidate cytidylyltransferase [Clostridiaceae bacterium]|nr:phosphatidate cytidylyltransferase [Clostridiaceae bacterium]